VKENKNLLREFNDIKENIKSRKEQVIDSRKSEDFNKIVDNLENRIPNSINIPYSELFDASTNQIKTKDKLKECNKN